MSTKVLVVDDDTGVRESTQLVLMMQGFDVITDNGDTVLDRIEAEDPDVVLLDIWLDGKNGVEVCQDIKSRKEGLKVILFSANGDIAKLADRAGSDSYIKKPFKLADLVQQIQRVVT